MNSRISGLYIGGIIQERRRRFIDRENMAQTEVVTYTLSDENDKKYFVEDFAPSEYREVGSQLFAPVYIKPYQKRNGDLSYTIGIKKDFDGGRGESF